MKDYRYIEGVATLELNSDKCVGCGLCATVCPHRIFEIRDRKAVILDFDACMECGACAQNCPTEALSVTPGVGCASYLISAWIHKLTGRKLDQGCC
ncbi:mercury methylation ferredoxin HgcB [Pseudodesulfovibrio portus]|uniref:Ferredoxin n=1 Tax=Pseudodesulfovibrio portus TaxID=231439 RepID=A0ABM8APE9_9BACT|nr:mercury methylation ferredoxin HgcB [Pseudodesulfovibrio portus]BDQ33253.1 ferredoxin [Pseudodesulfovibrio portus]